MNVKHPNTMIESERAARRDAFAGYADNNGVERHFIDGGCYYLSDRFGRYFAIGFIGKAIRPAFNYTFKTDQARADYIAKWTESLRRAQEARAQRRAEKRSETHGLQVGSVLVSSWGYDQTNVNWYQVTAVVSAKTVVVREIAGRTIPAADGGSAMSGYSTPCLNQFVGESVRVRAGRHGVAVKSYRAAPWDGMPKHRSWDA